MKQISPEDEYNPRNCRLIRGIRKVQNMDFIGKAFNLR
jgi:hypothetical protein